MWSRNSISRYLPPKNGQQDLNRRTNTPVDSTIAKWLEALLDEWTNSIWYIDKGISFFVQDKEIWQMLKNGWTFKRLCQVESADIKTDEWLPFHEVYRKIKIVDKRWSMGRRRGRGCFCLMSAEFLFRLLKFGVMIVPVMWVYLMQLNYTLKMISMKIFCPYIFMH